MAEHRGRLIFWIVVTGRDSRRFRINDSIAEEGLGAGKIALKGIVLREAMDTCHRFGWPPALIVVAMKTKGLPEDKGFAKMFDEK